MFLHCFHGFFFISRREKIGLREKRPVYPSGYVDFTKGIFRPIIRLKLMGSWFQERSANFNSVLSRENHRTLSSLGVSPLQYSMVCCEAVTRGLDDISND